MNIKIKKNKEKKEKIEKNNLNQKKNFNLLQGVDESTFSYNIRKSFVKLLKAKTKKQFELYVMYSYIFNNMYFLKCRYQESTEDFINNFLKKYGKKFLYKISG
jgi:hypothetical protein